MVSVTQGFPSAQGFLVTGGKVKKEEEGEWGERVVCEPNLFDLGPSVNKGNDSCLSTPQGEPRSDISEPCKGLLGAAADPAPPSTMSFKA